MKEFIKKLMERLEEEKNDFIEHMVDGDYLRGNVNFAVVAISIVNELAEEYMTCYKTCTECEAYDKEKHHCPKFCYIIAETVKEIEENHKGGWIPVSERLPELTEGTKCFKQSPVCLTTLKWWDGDMTESIGWYNQSGVWNEDSKNCKVVAWQPLPAPYQPKGE